MLESIAYSLSQSRVLYTEYGAELAEVIRSFVYDGVSAGPRGSADFELTTYPKGIALLPFGPIAVANHLLASKLRVDWPGVFEMQEVLVAAEGALHQCQMLLASTVLDGLSDTRLMVRPIPPSGIGAHKTRVLPGHLYPAAFRVIARASPGLAHEDNAFYERENFINNEMRLWWKRNRVGNCNIFPAIDQPGYEDIWARWWAESK